MLNQNIKQLIAAVSFFALSSGFVIAEQLSAVNSNVTVKLSENLYADAQLAKRKGVPIVVMFSQDGCLYCSIVREDFLKPMLISGEYENKAIIREVKIDSFDDVKDFSGKMIPSDELATHYRAYLTPTVIVFDSNGKVHRRIVGLVNEHYYSGDLDVAIDKAYSSINQVAQSN